MDRIIIIYSNKIGDEDVTDWGRLIQISDIEDGTGRLVSISFDDSEVCIERNDNADDFRKNPYIIYVKEYPGIVEGNEDAANIDKVLECVEQCLLNDKHIYVFVHDSTSRHHDQTNFIDGSVSDKIIQSLLEYGIKTDDLSIIPFWHDNSPDSRYPQLWPLIKSCIDTLCCDPEDRKYNRTLSAYKNLVGYLDGFNVEDSKEKSKKELSEILLPLAAHDLLKQANIENQDLQNSIFEAATISMDTLRSTFPDIIKDHPLDLDNYTEKFHNSLQKISTELFK